jgi:NADPH:quinone reductase-like Zn-dependent oxidoreductase
LRVLQFEIYGGPEVLHIAEQEIPKPGPTDILVRVHAATVGQGDCKLRAGLLQDFYRIDLPKIPGRYGSGVCVAVGTHVDSSMTGEEIVFAPLHTDSGSAADYVSIRAENTAAKPRNLDHVQTAALLQGANAAYACVVETGALAAGQKILIHGAAGSVGSACTELAQHLAARIIATCRAADRDYVYSLGADEVIAFDEVDFAEVVQNQDLVIDLVGGEIHRRSYGVLRRGGRLVYLHAAPIEEAVAEYDVRVMHAQVRNTGALLSIVCRLAEQGVFTPKIGRVLPLEQGALAHQLLEARAVRRGRIVLVLA